MTIRHAFTLGFAAALFAAGFAATADAAKPTTHARSHGTHMVAMHRHAHGRAAAPAVGADHSADSLNAQSLSRAQGATQ